MNPTPAGFWVRAGAFVIDAMLMSFVQLCATTVVVRVLGGGRLISALFVLPILYHGLMLGSQGATVGKMAAGVRIVTMDGSAMTYGRAFGRTALTYLSAAILMLGYLAAPFNPDKRTFHDYAAGTKAVHPEPISSARFWALSLIGAALPLLAVLGIAAAVAVPNFSKFQGRTRESMTRTNLALLRTGVTMRKAETGDAPRSLQELLEQKALDNIPVVHTQRHPSHTGAKVYGVEACGMNGPVSLEDSGGWGYVYAPGSFCHGKVFVDCSHEDSLGKRWSDY